MERDMVAELKRHYDAISSQELFHNHDYEPYFESPKNVIFATTQVLLTTAQYLAYSTKFPGAVRHISRNSDKTVTVEIIFDSSKHFQSVELYNLICTNEMNQQFFIYS